MTDELKVAHSIFDVLVGGPPENPHIIRRSKEINPSLVIEWNHSSLNRYILQSYHMIAHLFKHICVLYSSPILGQAWLVVLDDRETGDGEHTDAYTDGIHELQIHFVWNLAQLDIVYFLIT